MVGGQPPILTRGKIILYLLQFQFWNRLGLQLVNLFIQGGLRFFQRLALGQFRANIKLPGILQAAHPGPSVRGQFLLQHQLLVQPPRAGGQHLGQHRQGVGVFMAKGRRVIINIHVRVRLRLSVKPFLRFLRHLKSHYIRRFLFPLGNSPEIFFCLLQCLLRFEITYQNQG